MPADLGTVIVWNEAEAERWTHDPNGELGRVLMRAIGETVMHRARALAEKRTGRMAAEMTYEVGTDEIGVYADVISPVRSPAGFAYAIMHERVRKPRDRRPHRSLIPAVESLRGEVL